MEERESPRILSVHNPEVAAILTHPHTLRQLEPFLARENTVKGAAEETGEKPNTVLSRVRRFLKLELLEVAREESRRGRAVKVYRSTADGFFVPFEATSAESLEAALAERDAYWQELLRHNVVRARLEKVETYGTRIYRDPRGRLQVQMAVTPEQNTTTLAPDDPAVLSAWRDAVYLDFADAKALQREMFDLLKRYQQPRGAQRYIVRLGLAPIR